MKLHLVRRTQSSERQRFAEQDDNNSKRRKEWARKYILVTGKTPAGVSTITTNGELTSVIVATNSNVFKMPHHKNQYSAPGLLREPEDAA